MEFTSIFSLDTALPKGLPNEILEEIELKIDISKIREHARKQFGCFLEHDEKKRKILHNLEVGMIGEMVVADIESEIFKVREIDNRVIYRSNTFTRKHYSNSQKLGIHVDGSIQKWNGLQLLHQEIKNLKKDRYGSRSWFYSHIFPRYRHTHSSTLKVFLHVGSAKLKIVKESTRRLFKKHNIIFIQVPYTNLKKLIIILWKLIDKILPEIMIPAYDSRRIDSLKVSNKIHTEKNTDKKSSSRDKKYLRDNIYNSNCTALNISLVCCPECPDYDTVYEDEYQVVTDYG